jgi:hypothetical protein
MSKKSIQILVERGWFERLIEVRDLALKRDMELQAKKSASDKQSDYNEFFYYLMGYVSSAEGLLRNASKKK